MTAEKETFICAYVLTWMFHYDYEAMQITKCNIMVFCSTPLCHCQ